MREQSIRSCMEHGDEAIQLCGSVRLLRCARNDAWVRALAVNLPLCSVRDQKTVSDVAAVGYWPFTGPWTPIAGQQRAHHLESHDN